MKQLWTVTTEGNERKLRLHPHPGQLRVWQSEKRFTFMLAGVQSGKTTWGPFWLHRAIERGGPGDYLAVTASYDLFKLKMQPELLRIFTEVYAHEGWTYRASDRVIARGKGDNAYRIILRSANAPGGLESATAKAAWLDECGQDDFTLEVWEAVLRRLSLSEGPVLGTTTLYNSGWLKSEIYDRWKEGHPDYEVVQFESILNPAFPHREFERARMTMQDWRFQMFYRGQFARIASLIYNAFTDNMLVDPFPIPSDWRRLVGVDFGGANTATVTLAENPDTEVWYACHESLEGGKTSAQHAAALRERAEDWQDWQAIGGAPSETQQRMDWPDVGEPAIADVEGGIDRVVSLMQTDKLRVFRSLSGLRDELGSYRRKTDEAGNALDEIVDKRKYHRLDALRYVCTGITEGPAAGGAVELPDSAYTGQPERERLWQ